MSEHLTIGRAWSVDWTDPFDKMRRRCLGARGLPPVISYSALHQLHSGSDRQAASLPSFAFARSCATEKRQKSVAVFLTEPSSARCSGSARSLMPAKAAPQAPSSSSLNRFPQAHRPLSHANYTLTRRRLATMGSDPHERAALPPAGFALA